MMLLSITSFSQTSGTMTFTFTTPKHTSGNYTTDGRYVLAVWIESCTTCDAGTTVGTSTFVKTSMRYCGNGTGDHLPTWASKSGGSTISATTGATLSSFTSKTVTWDGTDVTNVLSSDGNYRVCVQETWGHGSFATVTRYFPFVKGTTTYTNTTDVLDDTSFTNISLTWSPTLSVVDNVYFKSLLVYPNPVSNIIYISGDNIDIRKICLYDINGRLVKTSKDLEKVDVSNLPCGLYLLEVSNDENRTVKKIEIK